jgi:hypothetical protein
MTKKCVDCDNEAEFKIKDTSEYYCKECAEEHFSDLSLLVKVKEDAMKLKKYLDDKELLKQNDEL